MKLVWVTDPHLELLHPHAGHVFGEELRKQGDALLVTGDIANFSSLKRCLKGLQTGFHGPVYFVLGNHDVYGGSFSKVETLARELVSKHLRWLDIDEVELTPSTVLLGVDGWYDCRTGDPTILNMGDDFEKILDFTGKPKEEVIRLSRERADAMAYMASVNLQLVAEKYRKVIFATHVPPFLDPTVPRNKIWDPWFTNLSLGNVLTEVAKKNPNTLFTVLCGHKHRPSVFKANHNLVVYTGEAEYFSPNIAQVITIT